MKLQGTENSRPAQAMASNLWNETQIRNSHLFRIFDSVWYVEKNKVEMAVAFVPKNGHF